MTETKKPSLKHAVKTIGDVLSRNKISKSSYRLLLRLRALRAVKKMSRKDFSEWIGVPYNTYLCWDSGRTIPGRNAKKRIYEGLKNKEIPNSMQWIFDEKEDAMRFNPTNGSSIDIVNPVSLIDSVLRIFSDDPAYLTYTINDTSMQEFTPNQVLVCRKNHDVSELRYCIGDIILAEVYPNTYIPRIVCLGNAGEGSLSLYATNPMTQNPVLENVKIYSWASITAVFGDPEKKHKEEKGWDENTEGHHFVRSGNKDEDLQEDDDLEDSYLDETNFLGTRKIEE